MGWVFLEIAAALAVAGVIVWWTLPRTPKARDEARGGGDDGKRRDA